MLNGRTSNGFKDKVRSGADAYTRCGGGNHEKFLLKCFIEKKCGCGLKLITLRVF